MRKTYAELLTDPRWQKKRLEVFERDGWTCCRCDEHKNKSLHIHHKRYFLGHNPWDYRLDDLETLCEDCHREEHGFIDVSKYLLALDDEGQITCYDLKKLKKLGLSIKGYKENGVDLYKYQNHFTVVDLSTNETYKIFATRKLKEEISTLKPFYTDRGFVYYKVPHELVGFYEAIHEDNEEITIIAGQSHKALAIHEFK